MKLATRFRKLSLWNKLAAVGAVCSILAFLGWLLWPKDSGQTRVKIDAEEDAIVQAAIQSPGAVQQNMQNSPGGLQVGGDLNVQTASVGYQPLSESLRQQTLGSLRRLARTNITIVVSAQIGSPNRIRVAQDLVSLLHSAGIPAQYERPSQVFTGDGRYPSIKMSLHREDSVFVQELVPALAPFIFARYEGKRRDKGSPGRITIHIFGEPRFTPEGRVLFD